MISADRPRQRFDSWRKVIHYGSTALVFIMLLAEPARFVHADPNQPESPQKTTIYNGKKILEAEAPYYVSINTKNSANEDKHYLGGAPVGPNAIITAAHIGFNHLGDKTGSLTAVNVTDPNEFPKWDPNSLPSNHRIVAEVNKILFPNDGETATSTDISNIAGPADFAVVCTKQPVTQDFAREGVQVIDSEQITDGLMATIVGNGLDGFDVGTGIVPDSALSMQAPFITSETCLKDLQNEHFAVPFSSAQACVGDLKSTKETPDVQMTNGGDSGSPVTTKIGEKTLYVGDVSQRLYNNALTIITDASKQKEFIDEAVAQCAELLGEEPPKNLITQDVKFSHTQQIVVLSPGHPITELPLEVSIQRKDQKNTVVDSLELAASIPYSCGEISDGVSVEGGTVLTTTQVDPKNLEMSFSFPETDEPISATISIPFHGQDCASPDPTQSQITSVIVPPIYYPNNEKNGTPVVNYSVAGRREPQENILPYKVEPTQLIVYTAEPLTQSVNALNPYESIVAAEFAHTSNRKEEVIQVKAERVENDLMLSITQSATDLEYGRAYFSVTDLNNQEQVFEVILRAGTSQKFIPGYFTTNRIFLPLVAVQ